MMSKGGVRDTTHINGLYRALMVAKRTNRKGGKMMNSLNHPKSAMLLFQLSGGFQLSPNELIHPLSFF